MTTIDGLREQLNELATAGPARSATALYDAATGAAPRRSRSRRPMLAVAFALVLIAGGLTTWRAWPDGGVRVTTHADQPSLGVPPPITVPSTDVNAVTLAFGKVWVASSNVVATATATLSASTTLRVYDAVTGRLLATVPTRAGAQTLIGGPLQFAVTDHAVWLRTSSQTEIFNGMYNVVYRIDPTEMKASANRYELNDGPLVGFGDRIAAADSAHLEIVREDGVELGLGSTEQVTQTSPGNPPGTNGLVSLHLDTNGLWAFDSGYSLMARVDRTTTSLLSDEILSPAVLESLIRDAAPSVPQRPTWWIRTGGTDARAQVLIGDDLARSVTRVVRVPTGALLMGQLDDRRVLLALPATTRGRYVIFDTTTGTSTPAPSLPDLRDAGPATVDVVSDAGTPLIVNWERIGADMSTVQFDRVPG